MFLNTFNSIERGFGLAQFDNRKHYVAALLSAAAALGSAHMSNMSTQANNERQEALVNSQNAYNTPAMQEARIRQAGLNPYMMLGQVNSGNQQSVASTQSTDYSAAGAQLGAAAQLAQQEPLVQAQARAANADAKDKLADAKTKTIRNMTELQRNKAELMKMLADTDVSKKQKEKILSEIKLIDEQQRQLNQENDVYQLSWDDHVKEQGVKNWHLKAQGDLFNSQKTGQDTENSLLSKYGDEQYRAMIAKAFADARSADASALLSRANVNVAKHEANSAYWNSRGSEYNYREARRLFDYNSAYHDNVALDYFFDKTGEVIHGGSEVTGSVNDVMNSRANRKNLKSQMRYRNAKMSKPARVPKVRL